MMTDRYSIISQENISWGSPVDQMAMDASCRSINDDSYVTAEEDNCEESQYLSVLENTTRVSLDLHDVTLSQSKINEQNEILSSDGIVQEDSQEQQVVIFTVEGSDDLYGLQVTQDEEGNVRRYQFQLRTTEDGQLEAMPETIQLVPEENDKEESVDVSHLIKSEAALQTNVEAPHISHISESEVFIEAGDIDGVNLNRADSKVGILENGIQLLQIDMQNDQIEEDSCHENDISVIVKGENLDNEERDDMFEELVEYRTESEENLELHQELVLDPAQVKSEIYTQKNSVFQEMFDKEDDLVENGEHIVETTAEFANGGTTGDENEMTVLEYQNYPSSDAEIVEDNLNEDHVHSPVASETYASLFMEGGCSENIEFVHESESDETEAYEAVESIHVTADTVLDDDLGNYETEEAVFQQVDDAEPLIAVNGISRSLKKITPKKTKPVLYYVMESQEKENVNSVPLNSIGKAPMKTHPRSILKSDMDHRLKPEVNRLKPVQYELHPANLKPDLPLSDKRFARSKRAVEERLFHNFINRTTIPHAPVRQTRLPRKQKIKPVDNRRDEEIIVQEVMVSSNGFIENTDERLVHRDKKVEVPTIELSDSEDERPSKLASHSRRKKRTSSLGSNTSETSVIEIEPSDEDSITETISISAKVMADSEELKRTRNKTPEGAPTTPELCGSPSKRSRTNMEGTSTDFNKREFTCPNCTKTFPSENSLSTHIQHHNLENSMLKNKSVQCKHMCDVCKKSFKNSFLLSRHTCLAAAKATHKCNICLTTFQDLVMLNNHKKTHNKQNMLNKTNNISICPTKFKSPARKTKLPRFSTAAPPRITVSRLSTSSSALRHSTIGSSLRQSPKKKSQLLQCKECQKVCSSLAILNVHERTHKKFNCITCKSSFASRILLDEHLRTSCVKTASPKVRRLSFKVRRSSIRLSRAPLTVSSSKNSRLSTFSSKPMNMSTMKCEPINMNAKCEDCDKTFRTMTALFKHKVKDHGLHTPDKRVLQEQKKTLHRPLATHGGIPVSDKLRKLWGAKQDLTKNKPVS